MQIQTIEINNQKIAEVISDEIIICGVQDGLDLLGNLYYQGFEKVILYQKNIIADFFDLKTGIAGEILQKFTNYRMPLIIIGEFENIQSKSLNDFIFESNKGKQVNFLKSKEEAVKKLINQH